MPMAPDAFYYVPPPGSRYDPYYAFWGGAWNQAGYKAAFARWARDLVDHEVYKLFQLPPDLPPK